MPRLERGNRVSPIVGKKNDSKGEVRLKSDNTKRSIDPITGFPVIENERVDFSNPTAWKNRRRMAWISLITMVGVTGLLLFAPEKVIPNTRIQILMEVLGWFYFAMASVIGAYMGFTTWATRR